MVNGEFENVPIVVGRFQIALKNVPTAKSLSDPCRNESDDSLDKIRKLGELHADGLITEEEFEAKKKMLLQDP